MIPKVGDWWVMDKNGRGPAHRVGAVLPDLTIHDDPTLISTTGFSAWIPLCSCGPRGFDEETGRANHRVESATLYSRFASWPDQERCSICEVMSAALDRWITECANDDSRYSKE